jgi:bromodomain adjacent to zinc finger domain protein 1A
MEKVSVLQIAVGPMLLGRDRAFRRFWMLESLPGVFVEHDDDFVGSCLPEPTPFSPNAGPLDEATALEKVRKTARFIKL